jgi:hypothetical protein
VASTIALLALVLGIQFLLDSIDFDRRAVAAESAELIRLNVDLSKPGKYVGQLAGAFPPAHDHLLQLRTEPPFTSQETAEAALAGLTGHLTVVDSQGRVVFEEDVNPQRFYAVDMGDGSWQPTLGCRLPGGTYQLKLAIDVAASRLDGIPQVLVGRNYLCGLEYLVGYVMWWLGIIGCTLSGVIGSIVVFATIVIRRKRVAENGPIAQIRG